MKRYLKSIAAILLAVMLTFTSVVPAFAIEISGPVEGITITRIDDNDTSCYVDSSSTLYVDQGTTATLQVTNSLPDDSSKATINISSDDFDTSHVSIVEVPESNSYLINVGSKARDESKLTFSTENGTFTKEITLKKCIPLSGFNLTDSGSTSKYPAYNSASAGTVTIPSITSFTNENVVIKVTRNNKSNDVINYSMWTDKECTIPATNVALDIDGDTCTITNDQTGTFYFKANAESFANSGHARDLMCVLRITYNEFKSIDTIGFNQKSYSLATVTNNTFDLSKELTYTPGNADEKPVYESNNETVATVDKNTGYVTALSGGTARITASGAVSGKSAYCEIVVKPEISKLELKADKQVLPVGSSMKIDCIKTPENAEGNIAWKSSNPEAVSVNNEGIIKVLDASSVKTVTITATSDSGVSISIDINIEDAIRTSNIKISPEKVGNAALKLIDANTNTYSVYANDTVTLVCNQETADGKIPNDMIVWRVSVNNGPEKAIEEEINNIASYSYAGSNLTVKLSSESTYIFTAYSILPGQTDFTGCVADSIAIQGNAKSTGINHTGRNTTIATNSSYEFEVVTLLPNVPTNKDSIVFESSNTDVANVSYDPITKKVVVTSTGNIGTAKIIAYACYDTNDYKNCSAKKEITITVSRNIASANVTGIGNVSYKGSAYGIKDFPNMTVTFGENVLVYGTDYAIAFENNVSAGMATMIITGKSAYAGTKIVPFTINQLNISGIAELGNINNQVYNGNPITPPVSVKANGLTLKSGADYDIAYANNTNAGIATVTVTGKGNFTGTASTNFNILPISLKSGTTIKLSSASFDHTGQPITPEVTVIKNKVNLVQNIDYIVTYSDNTNIGTAKITVTGIGNYTEAATSTFKIVHPKTIDSTQFTSVSAIKDQIYNGKPITPPVTVKVNGATLKSGTDYDISYLNNVNVGVATATITGKGNYKGTTTVSFNILPLDLTKGTTIKLTSADPIYYTGKALKPNVAVSRGTTVLTNGVDYTVAYSNNVKAGTATITVTGIGNYKGAAATKFIIEPSPKGASMVNGSWVNKKYKKASISKLVSKKKKKINISWKKVKGIAGYQIQISTDKKFKKNVSVINVANKATVKAEAGKLKSKKKYYVRIRTYKVVKYSGKVANVYSSWSKVKTVKVK